MDGGKMEAFYGRYGRIEIEWVDGSHGPPTNSEYALRVCSLSPHHFLLLTTGNNLFEAKLQSLKLLEGHQLRLYPTPLTDISDVQFCRDTRKLYIVKSGSVLMQTPRTEDGENLALHDNWEPVVFDPLEVFGVCIKRVCCSSKGTIFVSSSGDIYTAGNCGGHFSVDCSQPKLVRLFKNPVNILDVSAGDDFFVFLTSRRQASSSSIGEYGELPDLVCSDVHHKTDGSEMSSSVRSSLSTSSDLESNIKDILQHGHSLLHTEVFSMGSVNKGLLGTGDHIKRDSVLSVLKLKDIGVCSVSTGAEHTCVRTVDGNLFHWGFNKNQQLTASSQVYELSSPTEITFDSSDLDARTTILEACCGDYRTVLLNTQGEIFDHERQPMYREKDFVTLQMRGTSSSKQSYPLLLACSQLTIYNRRQFKQQYHMLYQQIQAQTAAMMRFCTQFHQLNRLMDKMIWKDLQDVSTQWENVLCLAISVLHSLEMLYRGDYDDSSKLVVVKYCRECIKILESYSKAYCDIYSIDGFEESQQMFQHSLSPKATEISTANSSARTNRDILKMFQQPFNILPYITQLLEHIHKNDDNCKDELATWLEFVRHNRIDLELADSTRDFWRSNKKNSKILRFKEKERRVILTSTAVPLKLSNSIVLSPPTFILFSDCLCQVVNYVIAYPLEAMWLKKEDLGIRVITPEKNVLLIAKSSHDHHLWYDQLECSIRRVLNLSEKSKICEVRSIDYNFSSNHSIYPGVYVKGSFSNGVMHGKCRLQYPTGKIYSGDVIHNSIEGYGRMFVPKVGLFHGSFCAGKFSGYGTLIVNEKEIYNGNFRNGLFHGHGHYQHSSDYVYVGNFEDNLRCGYGVLYKFASGDKYLGFFADNKKIGKGICITANGDYFEGSFANDELTGKSVAILANQFYYEGDASLSGPNGTGKYYMPTVESTRELDSILFASSENAIVTGNILSGQLSGSWESVKINAGSMDINVTFSHLPSSLGSYVVENFRKWSTLFFDFENELFGDAINFDQNKALKFALWNRVVAFINRQQEIESEKETPLDHDISNTISPSTTNNSKKHFWSQSLAGDFDKLSLNSSLFNFEKVELTKLHSLSQDDTLSFSNFDLLSTFSKRKDENQENPSFSTLLGVMEKNCSSSGINSFNDSALSNSVNLNDECISLQAEMDIIPQFGLSDLTEEDLYAIKDYLKNAFRYRFHPLKHLNDRITHAFYRSYGCWSIKPTPLVAKQAMQEWESISQRVYKFIRRLFPALPEECAVVGENREVVSHITLLYPILLSEGVYSTLFVLYANKYSHKDELYRQNLLQAEKFTDQQLVDCLELDNDILTVVGTSEFSEAVQMLKELKDKYSPMAMLTVIENCMEQLTRAYQKISLENQVSMNADVIMPLSLVLLLRAGINHLGAELALLDDLTSSQNFQLVMTGIRGYCYTTLKASYEHLTIKSLFEHSKLQ